MSLRYLVSRQSVSKLTARVRSQYAAAYGFATITDPVPSSVRSAAHGGPKPIRDPNPRYQIPMMSFNRGLHSAQVVDSVDSAAEEEEDGGVNEFLSRFVFIIRRKLNVAYPGCDKETVDGMLRVIVQRVVEEMEKGGFEQMLGVRHGAKSEDFSEDLWRTVWEVSHMVMEDMRKEARKEKMKGFLHAEEVKEMCRFAGEVGIRGDMLRELRFKWAHEKMEETEFYESLELLREQDKALEEGEEGEEVVQGQEAGGTEVNAKVGALPKRRGKIRYDIYGLDLSDPKWVEVADKVHEAEEIVFPQDPKPIYGKCKLVTERILQSNEADDLSPLLAEWVELLQPGRVDWVNLLNKLKEQNSGLYIKVAELVLDEKSFQTNIRDYSMLIDAYAKKNHLEDAERILKKMMENGFEPDILTSTILVHMYSKAGNLEAANQAFKTLTSVGFKPDMKVYNSMIKAFVNANRPKQAEALMREMEKKDIQPTQEIYLALLRSYAQNGDVSGAGRIINTMLMAGFPQTVESCLLLVDAYGKAGDPDQARQYFDHILNIGHKPEDKCTASMIAAYEKKNLLDKALDLLLQLEKNGFQPGVATYTVLVDWLGKMQLVSEAEQLLDKISELGEAPPLRLHVSICDMYAKAGVEKKALQALGVLETKKDQLCKDEFERIIKGLIKGGFLQDAQRMQGVMEAQGFTLGDEVKLKLNLKQMTGRRTLMR